MASSSCSLSVYTQRCSPEGSGAGGVTKVEWATHWVCGWPLGGFCWCRPPPEPPLRLLRSPLQHTCPCVPTWQAACVGWVAHEGWVLGLVSHQPHLQPGLELQAVSNRHMALARTHLAAACAALLRRHAPPACPRRLEGRSPAHDSSVAAQLGCPAGPVWPGAHTDDVSAWSGIHCSANCSDTQLALPSVCWPTHPNHCSAHLAQAADGAVPVAAQRQQLAGGGPRVGRPPSRVVLC